MSRYSRQISLPNIGVEGQEKLSASRVLIIGAGGLGSPAAQYLTGAGIGRTIIADGDVVSLSNLHRQPIYKEADIGSQKATLLCKHLTEVNSEVDILSVNSNIDESNALEYINQVDIVLDCTDNLKSRYLINDACVVADKAFISASIYRNEGQLGVFNYRGSGTYRCLYPEGKNTTEIPSCDELGVLGTLPGSLGILQANEAIKIILGIGNLLTNKILYTSALNNTTSSFSYSRNEREVQGVINRGLRVKSSKNLTINIKDLSQLDRDEWTFIDVRDTDEKPHIKGKNLISLPLNELDSKVVELDRTESYVCFCHAGIRSIHTANKLHDVGFKKVLGFTGDINDLITNNYLELKQNKDEKEKEHLH